MNFLGRLKFESRVKYKNAIYPQYSFGQKVLYGTMPIETDTQGKFHKGDNFDMERENQWKVVSKEYKQQNMVKQKKKHDESQNSKYKWRAINFASYEGLLPSPKVDVNDLVSDISDSLCELL